MKFIYTALIAVVTYIASTHAVPVQVTPHQKGA